ADYVLSATKKSIGRKTQSLTVGLKVRTDQDTMEEKGNVDCVAENLCSKLGSIQHFIGANSAETKQLIRISPQRKQ
ncbi:unnamed protein product, partial [marine sediment metagenome]